ncbi:hypothetical protein IWQ62_002702 [Dispira parvispora]|uniref:Secreted protein n=1 Tax=Dispira parvispora TaxID=1520584 RepID=A0A9W8E779_9FUNG|nr:hypothetical protein IWQ62_002702 [Dispira parvispora]
MVKWLVIFAMSLCAHGTGIVASLRKETDFVAYDCADRYGECSRSPGELFNSNVGRTKKRSAFRNCSVDGDKSSKLTLAADLLETIKVAKTVQDIFKLIKTAPGHQGSKKWTYARALTYPIPHIRRNFEMTKPTEIIKYNLDKPFYQNLKKFRLEFRNLLDQAYLIDPPMFCFLFQMTKWQMYTDDPVEEIIFQLQAKVREIRCDVHYHSA